MMQGKEHNSKRDGAWKQDRNKENGKTYRKVDLKFKLILERYPLNGQVLYICRQEERFRVR